MNRLSRSWLVATLAVASLAAQAQTQVQGVVPPVEPKAAAQAIEPQAASNTQQVVIQSIPTQAVQVKQPVTVVEASSLGESRADQMRRARQDIELQTEQKIVEKLEQSRLEDERRRMDKLFGAASNVSVSATESNVQIQTTNVPVIAAPVPAVPVVAPVPVVAQPTAVVVQPTQSAAQGGSVAIPEADRQALKTEIISEIRDGSQKPTAPSEVAEGAIKAAVVSDFFDRTYFTGLIGTASYPGVANVEGRLATGFSFGSRVDKNIMVEGQFMYSNYYLNDAYFAVPGYFESLYRNLDQYNFALNAKFGFGVNNTIQPYLGGGVAYVYRNYKDLAIAQQYPYGTSVYPLPWSASSISSHAFDLAGLMGLNIRLTRNFLLGVEYRYSFNLTYWASSDFNTAAQMFRYGRDLVEQTSYQTFGVTASYLF